MQCIVRLLIPLPFIESQDGTLEAPRKLDITFINDALLTRKSGSEWQGYKKSSNTCIEEYMDSHILQ